jgi:hypothetical protein
MKRYYIVTSPEDYNTVYFHLYVRKLLEDEWPKVYTLSTKRMDNDDMIYIKLKFDVHIGIIE